MLSSSATCKNEFKVNGDRSAEKVLTPLAGTRNEINNPPVMTEPVLINSLRVSLTSFFILLTKENQSLNKNKICRPDHGFLRIKCIYDSIKAVGYAPVNQVARRNKIKKRFCQSNQTIY